MPKSELGNALHPADIVGACRSQYERHEAQWLLDPSSDAWPLSVDLRAPSAANAAQAPASLRQWIAAWSAFESDCRARVGQVSVSWRTVNWRVLGNVTLPDKVAFGSAETVAECAGVHARWKQLNERWHRLLELLPSMAGQVECVRAAIATATWSTVDFDRLLTLLQWSRQGSAGGLYLRQLPLVGIHTKWVEERVGVLVPLLRVVLGRVGDLAELLNLRSAPQTIRMRLLDPVLRAQVGKAEDLQIPVPQWSSLFREPPKRLLIVENLATGLALPDIKDTAVAMRLGNNVYALRGVAWAHDADVAYWGDIDTWGLHILARAREVFPGLQSVLMSEEVLHAHRELWTHEKTQESRPAAHLTAEEAKLLSDLQANRWGENVRLEQERLHWPDALSAVHRHWQARTAPPRR
ncbi:MAG: DUF2220 family protein [Rubrivivax sp.]